MRRITLASAVLFAGLLVGCSRSSRDGVTVPGGTCTVTPSASWTNTLALPNDPFVHRPLGTTLPAWVKFAVLECDPSRIVIQDSNAFPFHYDFATTEIDGLLGLSREAFDLATLYDANRYALLGAVLLPPLTHARSGDEEYGLQLISQDPLAPNRVIEVAHLVRASLGAAPTAELYYMPSFEQEATAHANAAFFQSRGVPVSSTTRWSPGVAVYASGWALGTLRSFPPDELFDAYERGDLGPSDILLTEGVPASVPLVAGILTLRPATPSSHTAILAQTFGVPFGFLAQEADAEHARSLVGRRVLMRAYETFAVPRIDVVDVQDALDDATVAELLQLKRPEDLDLAVVAPLGEIARSTQLVGPGDAATVGGKAAGFGVLRRSIPDASPPAIALSFDLWTGFMDAPLDGGGTLRDAIEARLGAYAFPPVSMAALAADLNDVRDWIRDPARTSFAPEHGAAVLDALLDPAHGFDRDAKLRFRSSSNMEDAERFTGAGLYESVSGCVLDDLDSDELGPSHCDPDKPDERGVFRAIRKVFASFFDESAFLARLRYGVDERDVGMAVLVHHSFPDAFELANGVVTLTRSSSTFFTVDVVAQAGAESVTNPQAGQVPELSTGYGSDLFETVLDLHQHSNLLPIGATVLDDPVDYVELARLANLAALRFGVETGKPQYVLEFEFKKLAPGGAAVPAGGVVLKQLRQIPVPDTTRDIEPFLIGGTEAYETSQGEGSNVLAIHRLKSELELTTNSGWLDDLLDQGTLYSGAVLRFTDGCTVRDQTFDLADPLQAMQFRDGAEYELGLEQSTLANPRSLALRTQGLRTRVSPAESPILLPRDLPLWSLGARYAQPVMTWEGALVPTVTEAVTLGEPRDDDPTDILQTRNFVAGGVEVDVRFFWPTTVGLSGGYTAPLARWGTTTITGLTTMPIVLEGEFSQSYRPAHHNFSEDFVFAPLHEVGLPPLTRAELDASGIHLIRVTGSPFAPSATQIETYSASDIGHACPLAVAR